MMKFLSSRTIQSIILLWIVSVIGFLILHLAPGGPLAQFALVPGMSHADLQLIAHQMGLDRPLPIQYFEWISRLLSGDWGISYRDKRPVLQVIWKPFLATVELILASSFIAIFIGTWVGILRAIKRYSVFDYLATVGAMVGLSIPTFWSGLVVIFVFSVQLGLIPAGNMHSVGDSSFLDFLHHLIAPSVVLAIVTVAVWSRYMRSSMLGVINQDFIRTARSKGISEHRVLWHHTIRNALLPMITIAGLEIPQLLSGALVTETIFTWPGIGRLFLDSLGYRDYPVIMGILMFCAIVVLIGNLVADILYAIADPRLRLN